MFEKITKKEFINELCNNESVRLCSFVNMDEALSIKVMQSLYNTTEVSQKSEVRTVTRKQTNAIKFNDGSWLYFNDIKKCLKHNNVILSFNERYDKFDKIYKYDVIAYYIK